MSSKYPSVCKLCRSVGEKLFLKGDRCFTPKCAMTKRPYSPGQHGEKRRSKVSDYGRQLKEKQKARRLYGLSERQMRNIYRSASKSKKNTGELILKLLESKLDNILYRSGLVKSRAQAAQIISHGKVYVNKKKTKAASYMVKNGDAIKITKNIPDNENGKPKSEVPGWLKVNHKEQNIIVESLPSKEQIMTPVEEQLIVEYYSRLL